MHPFFKKILAARNLEYLEVDENFNILETSLGVQRFADRPQDAIVGKDVRLSFPEIVGLEDILVTILEGQRYSFGLKGIGRSYDLSNPLYIDIYIINDREKEGVGDYLIICLEDVTERMVLEQSLVQKSNEASLLLDAWAASSQYLTQIIKSMADALFVTTPSAVIKIVNKAAQILFGYSESELIGQPISLIVTDRNFISQIHQPNPLIQKFSNPIEVVCQSKTGEKITVAFSCSAIESDVEDQQDVIYIGRELR